jgi:hypothetical protein
MWANMRKKQMQLCQQGWGFLLMKGISSFENLALLLGQAKGLLR